MNIKAAELTDPLRESELAENGYVVFKELFSKEEIAVIKGLYEKCHLEKDPQRKTMWNSLYDIELSDALRASEQILEILKPKLDQIFQPFKAPVAILMAKNMGESSACFLHRDTSILDESRYEYRNLWIPLTDTDEKNGALYFVRGSHQIFTFPRPPALPWHYAYLEKDLIPYQETIYSGAGDCIVFLDKTLHGSHQNFSHDYRPVIFFGVLHPEAETLYYYYDEQAREMRAYGVTPEFYFRGDYSEPVGMPLRLTLPYDPPRIESGEVLSKLASHRQTR